MKRALIGCTGIVDGNLHQQNSFEGLYNSENITDIIGNNFDVIAHLPKMED